jgi:hypothetical protein
LDSFNIRGRADDPARTVLAPLGIAVVALLLSGALAYKKPNSALVPLAVIAVVVVVALALPRRWRSGVLIGALVMAGIDSFPGPDLSARIVAGGLTAQEGVVVVLIVVVLGDVVTHHIGWFFGTTLGRVLLLSSLANLAWWLYTFLRTTTVPGIVTKHAFTFGVSFLFIYALIPLLAASFQRRDTRLAALFTIGVLGLVSAAFYFVGSVGHAGFGFILHANAQATSTTGSLTRLYAPARDLYAAAFTVSCAAALCMPAGRWQRVITGAALVDLLAIAATQTRAQYLGTIVGFGIASLLFLSRPGGRLAVLRLARTLAVIATIVAVLLAVVPNSKPSDTIQSFGSRLGSISSSVSSSNTSNSTLAVRSEEETLLKQRLGSHWLLGLGFIDVTDMYDANLPGGTINNADVGISATVLSMGLIGTLLYYVPLLAVIGRLVWQSRYPIGSATWIRYGALAGLLSVLASSITLTTFFGRTGVVVVACLLALGSVVTPIAPRRRFDGFLEGDGKLHRPSPRGVTAD